MEHMHPLLLTRQAPMVSLLSPSSARIRIARMTLLIMLYPMERNMTTSIILVLSLQISDTFL